ncbi:transport and Golgi organization protein 2 homolog isoform X1 [Diadema setosum]|uniref:transport and Golgi organization protein 2 homolog isoform X1 n=2 Tax=Diadema setosum TaxID=31175 RepID=UPI003B3AB7B7
MCVTAFYMNPDSKGGFRFIIAFNRDELFNRPTKTADFWAENPDVISSVDMTTGKEGGTWLGMSKKGRLAFILNIFSPDGIREDAKGRGALVSNFLTGEMTAKDYLTELVPDGENYNGFNLFAVDLKSGEVGYYSNKSASPPQILQPGVYGVSNSTIEKPWPKASHLKGSLEDFLANSSEGDAEGVAEKLHQALRQTTLLNGEEFSYKPGMTIEEMRAVLPQMLHVKSPFYGTRTSTVIVVGAKGDVLYSEKSIEEPVDGLNPRWTSKTHKFQLSCSL